MSDFAQWIHIPNNVDSAHKQIPQFSSWVGLGPCQYHELLRCQPSYQA